MIACGAVVLVNEIVPEPGVNVPPLFVQSLATEKFPAAVTFAPELTCTFPNVVAVVGVIVEFPVNMELLPALSVSPPVAETVTLFANLTVAPETVVKTGVVDASGPKA